MHMHYRYNRKYEQKFIFLYTSDRCYVGLSIVEYFYQLFYCIHFAINEHICIYVYVCISDYVYNRFITYIYNEQMYTQSNFHMYTIS